MSPRLPSRVTYEQLAAACEALGVDKDAGVREVHISFGGEDRGATFGVLVRNRDGQFVTHDDEPLTAYAHAPMSWEEATDAASR